MKVGVWLEGEFIDQKRTLVEHELGGRLFRSWKADVHLCVLIILTAAMNQLFSERNFWSVPTFHQEQDILIEVKEGFDTCEKMLRI